MKKQCTDIAILSQIEQIILKEVSRLSKKEKINLDDDFFRVLNVDSLFSMSLGSQIEQIFKIYFPVAWVFQNPSISLLSQKIDESVNNNPKSLKKLV